MEIRSETEITPLRCSSIRILFGALDCRSELAALMASRVEGFGSVMWWGFSPSQDLGALANEGKTRRSLEAAIGGMTIQSDHVNILLVGCGDLRHVMQTVANSHQYTTKPLHFYITESCLEVLARHMLFLSLLFEPPDKLGPQEKVELFLELFGNSLVRAQSVDYLRSKATELIKMVTDLDYLKVCIPVLDISGLKFKERDLLEGIFKFWRSPDNTTFDTKKHWEGRLRHYLGARYDSRSGVFDWDCQMKLKEMAPVVNPKEYSEWREGGVAFRLRDDAPYETSNRTLASGVVISQGGNAVAKRGYWGDIVNSPYLSFGVESENKELFKTVNGRPAKTSMGVSEWNLLSLIQILTTGERAGGGVGGMMPEKDSGELGTIRELSDEEGEELESANTALHNGQSRSEGPLFNGSCFISFLPLGSASEIGKKAKFKELFNVAYFSNSMVHHLTSGISDTFAPDCTLVLETARFMLDLKKEQREEYTKKVTGMAESVGYKVPIHSSNDSNCLAFICAGT